MFKKFRNFLLMGFIVLLPAIATLYVLQFLFSFIDRILGNFFTGLFVAIGFLELLPNGKINFWGIHLEERIPGVGFILMVLILLAVGYATQSNAGQEAIRFTERTFKKIPLARSIYSTVQQITTAFIQDRSSFKKVVLVEYPRKGIFTIGFLTGEAQGEVQAKTHAECVNVFLPTTPNPTSGWLVLVPKEDVVYLDMSVEEGLKFIISGGVVVPRSSKYPILQNTTADETQRLLKRIHPKEQGTIKVTMNKKEE